MCFRINHLRKWTPHFSPSSATIEIDWLEALRATNGWRFAPVLAATKLPQVAFLIKASRVFISHGEFACSILSIGFVFQVPTAPCFYQIIFPKGPTLCFPYFPRLLEGVARKVIRRHIGQVGASPDLTSPPSTANLDW